MLDNKLRQFRKLALEAKLTELYKEVLILQDKKQELPATFTNRLYTLREAAEHVNMSREWLTKEIRAGRVQAKFEKNKYYLSWTEIVRIKESRSNKYK